MRILYKAFTILEILVVITVVIVLAAISIPSYQRFILKSEYTELTTLLRSYTTEVAEYYNSTGNFPPSLNNTTAASETTLTQYKHVLAFTYNFSSVDDKAWWGFRLDGLNPASHVFFCVKGQPNGAFEVYCGTWSGSSSPDVATTRQWLADDCQADIETDCVNN